MSVVTGQPFESFGKVCSVAVILAMLIDIKADYKVARIVAALKEAHESKRGRRLNRRLTIIKQFFLFCKMRHLNLLCSIFLPVWISAHLQQAPYHSPKNSATLTTDFL
jgi:hypothetical protein